MIRGNCCNGLTHVANHVFREYWLIFTDEAICQLTRNIVCSNYTFNAGDVPCAGEVNGDDAGIRMWGPKSRTPQHIFCVEV